MSILKIAEDLSKLIINKYGSFYKAGKQTGLHSVYFTNLKNNPTIGNVIRIADKCGFGIVMTIKEKE